MKRKKNRKNRIRCGKSERFLKIVVTVSLLFAALMLYPLVFAVSSAMKDNSQIYKVPPEASFRERQTAYPLCWIIPGRNFRMQKK